MRERRTTGGRWVLAFDAGCAACRRIAATVEHACEGRLEVAPLDGSEVASWRSRETTGTGDPGRGEPTLFRVDGSAVRAWTGTAMVPPLVRRLGARSTLALLRALGELRHQATRPLPAPGAGGPGTGPGREPGRSILDRQFGRQDLLRLGGGLAAAGVIVLAGRTPAFAAQAGRTAEAWAREHAGRLPQAYADVTAYPVPYRRAIYRASSGPVRSRLWRDHVAAFRRRQTRLTAGQAGVLDDAAAVAATVHNLRPGHLERDHGRLVSLRERARREFGADRAYALLGVLGEPEPGAAPARTAALQECACATTDDYCAVQFAGTCFQEYDCVNPRICNCTYDGGCGTFYSYDCNGLCG